VTLAERVQPLQGPKWTQSIVDNWFISLFTRCRQLKGCSKPGGYQQVADKLSTTRFFNAAPHLINISTAYKEEDKLHI
jgi:hypothetical protein